jgi:hypothetical protein
MAVALVDRLANSIRHRQTQNGRRLASSAVVVGGEASRLGIVSASKGFWDVTGAQPVLGALPSDADSPALAITQRVFVIAGLLYGVQPHDTATFAMMTLALGSIGCLACVVPALKAALVDPVTSLRAE